MMKHFPHARTPLYGPPTAPREAMALSIGSDGLRTYARITAPADALLVMPHEINKIGVLAVGYTIHYQTDGLVAIWDEVDGAAKGDAIEEFLSTMGLLIRTTYPTK